MTREEEYELALTQRKEDERAVRRPTGPRFRNEPRGRSASLAPTTKAAELDRLNGIFSRVREAVS